MTDTYRIVKREVDASIDGKPCSFKVKRYYVTFYGREPATSGPFKDPFVEVWADNSITLNDGEKRIFLYGDRWRGIVAAINDAMRDIREAREAAFNTWLNETANATVFDGVRVDLTRTQVIEALTSCPIELEAGSGRTRPVIIFNGERHVLGRTDLHDDVATGLCANKTAEEWRSHYLASARACYGGRITCSHGIRLFSVIDALSDG